MQSSPLLRRLVGFAVVASLGAAPAAAQAPAPLEINTLESAIVDSSAQVLREIMTIPGRAIPSSLLQSAEGLVIVPGLLKGGFVIGARHGRGVVMVRDPAAGWQMPQLITVTGGSIGWQAGIQATDLVLVFKTRKSVQGLLSGKFTIGADAAAAAGPVGREAAAATDARLQAEIYSYSRSRGLFAGVSVDGSKLELDRNATDVYYRTVAAAPGQAMPLPASSLRLIHEVNQYAGAGPNTAGNPAVAVAPVAIGPVAVAAPAADPAQLRMQLAASSQRLGAIVDDQWRNFLALPAEVYGGDRLPTAEALTPAVERFRSIAMSPQYAALASRPEFIETSQLLQQLSALAPRQAIALPPPPQQ